MSKPTHKDIVEAFLGGTIFSPDLLPKIIGKNDIIIEQISAIEGQLIGSDPKNKENDTVIESLNFKLHSLKESLRDDPQNHLSKQS